MSFSRSLTFVKIFFGGLFLLLLSCSEEKKYIADFEVIPLPQTVDVNPSKCFSLDENTVIVFEAKNPRMVENAQFLACSIQQAMGLVLPITSQVELSSAPKSIHLKINENVSRKEAYQILIQEKEIILSAGDDEGIFRAIQTLKKSLPLKSENFKRALLPVGHIEDEPQFAYRGVMIDVARMFYPMSFLKKTVDMMALHQLNRLHLHLSDDQGWRLEIKKYPRLTSVGAFRKDSLGNDYGGFYSQSEMEELVLYAKERYVEIIPEIDMPGHLSAALTAYPFLGCRGKGYHIEAKPGVRKDVLCVGNPRSISFMKDVLEEVMRIFPSEYIHIGGDEVPRERWAECSKCQQKIHALNLHPKNGHTAEQYLQGRFNAEIQHFVESHGRKVVGWDEMLESEVDTKVTIMAWRGLGKGYKALRDGHRVILSPTNTLYLDYYQSVNISSEPLAIGGFLNAEMVYGADFLKPELTSEQMARIDGVQANLWTTYVPTEKSAEYMLLPRVTALSEMAWRPKNHRSYEDFLRRYPRMKTRLEEEDWHPAPHLYTVSAQFEQDEKAKGVQVNLTTEIPAKIRYTLDGTLPNEASPVYEGHLLVENDANLCVVAQTKQGVKSDVYHKTVHFNKATLKPVTFLTKPVPRFSKNELVDGVRATTIFGRGGWTGYFDEDMSVEIDLEDTLSISRAGVSTLIDYGSHIMDLSRLEIFTSVDGVHYEMVASKEVEPLPHTLKKTMPKHLVEFPPHEARYVRMKVCRQKKLPAEISVFGATQPFVFVDELYVY